MNKSCVISLCASLFLSLFSFEGKCGKTESDLFEEAQAGRASGQFKLGEFYEKLYEEERFEPSKEYWRELFSYRSPILGLGLSVFLMRSYHSNSLSSQLLIVCIPIVCFISNNFVGLLNCRETLDRRMYKGDFMRLCTVQMQRNRSFSYIYNGSLHPFPHFVFPLKAELPLLRTNVASTKISLK